MQIYNASGEDVGYCERGWPIRQPHLALKAGVYRARIAPSYPDETLSSYSYRSWWTPGPTSRLLLGAKLWSQSGWLVEPRSLSSHVGRCERR
jgi:hypothetical protein